MTNSKSIKRALFSSVVALFLCFSMLLGTTFAWFTDSASTAVNTIQAGNLDIVVSYALQSDVVDNAIPDNAWKEIDESTPVFNPDALWEPGYTEVVYFKIENKGSLALKYLMSSKIASEKPGTNKAGEEFMLSKYLTAFQMTADTATIYDERAAAQDPLGGFAAMFPNMAPANLADAVNAEVSSAKALSYETKLESGETLYTTMVIFMPTTVGNEANHNGVDVPSIQFGINVLATQLTYEKDSYDDQYDADAEYPVVYDHVVSDLAGLKNAFSEGGTVILTDDIECEKITPVEPGADVYLNLNGKTITVDEDTTSNTLFWVKEGAKLTVDGNGTIDMGSVSTMAIFCPYGELVIENGTFIRDKVTTVTDATTGLFMGAKISASNVTINGGYFDPGYYDENAADIEDILAGNKTLTETTDDIAKRGQPGDANVVRVAVKDNVSVVLNHSGYGSFKVYGGTFVGANPAWGDEGCMLPTTPNYLRPWSYYQGALLDGQTFNENGIVLPDGYTITKGATADGIPTYTVEYNK